MSWLYRAVRTRWHGKEWDPASPFQTAALGQEPGPCPQGLTVMGRSPLEGERSIVSDVEPRHVVALPRRENEVAWQGMRPRQPFPDRRAGTRVRSLPPGADRDGEIFRWRIVAREGGDAHSG